MLFLLATGACVIYVAFVGFILFGYFRNKADNNTGTNIYPTISIIVAARNEAKNLPELLTALFKQDYPKKLAEIIIVDDRSTDETAEILRYFAAEYTNLKIITVTKTPDGISPKKHALSQAIAEATGELIFTTDADCLPPTKWLSKTAALFVPDIGLVFGFAPFCEKNGFFNKILQLDNLANALVAAGGVGWQIGITCTGRNLAYRKSVYEQVSGFTSIQNSLSGDDDLFLQLVTRKTGWRIAFCQDADAAVPSATVSTFTDFVRQRRRHVSAGQFYSKPLQFSYLVFNLANLLMFICLASPWLLQTPSGSIVLLFCIKLIADLAALASVTFKLQKLKLLVYFPLWEIFNFINQVLVSPLGFIGKVNWKK